MSGNNYCVHNFLRKKLSMRILLLLFQSSEFTFSLENVVNENFAVVVFLVLYVERDINENFAVVTSVF